MTIEPERTTNRSLPSAPSSNSVSPAFSVLTSAVSSTPSRSAGGSPPTKRRRRHRRHQLQGGETRDFEQQRFLRRAHRGTARTAGDQPDLADDRAGRDR